PAEVQTLAVHPDKVAFEGSDGAQQLIVSATLADGQFCDLSGDATFAVADPKIASVTPAGRVVPLADGDTEVTIRYGEKLARVPVHCEKCGENLPINFGNQIVPIFTKLGCNSGGCHGKASGQNGFKISLLGFEPDVDFAALVYEGRGRRLFPAN